MATGKLKVTYAWLASYSCWTVLLVASIPDGWYSSVCLDTSRAGMLTTSRGDRCYDWGHELEKQKEKTQREEQKKGESWPERC